MPSLIGSLKALPCVFGEAFGHFVLSEILQRGFFSIWIQMVLRIKSGAVGAAVYRVSEPLLLPQQPRHQLDALVALFVCFISPCYIHVVLAGRRLRCRTRRGGNPKGNEETRRMEIHCRSSFMRRIQGHKKTDAQLQEVFIRGGNVTQPIVHFVIRPSASISGCTFF